MSQENVWQPPKREEIDKYQKAFSRKSNDQVIMRSLEIILGQLDSRSPLVKGLMNELRRRTLLSEEC